MSDRPKYYIGYAASNRSKCKGRKPCHGTFINKGELRFGTSIEFRGNYGALWRHWGCLTPKIFDNMKKEITGPSELEGYQTLTEPDKAKILKAWEDGHVADEDVPESARKAVDSESGIEEKQKKEKKAMNGKNLDDQKTGKSMEGAEGENGEGTKEKNKKKKVAFSSPEANTPEPGRPVEDIPDIRLNRVNVNTHVGIHIPDSYLYPLPRSTPEKPPNADKLFWTKGSWKGEQRSFTYLVTTEGKLQPGDKREEILTSARGLWSDSAIQAGWHARTWEKCGDKMKDLFIFGIERKFPELALCASHWKAHQIAEDHYDVWRDGFFRRPVDDNIDRHVDGDDAFDD